MEFSSYFKKQYRAGEAGYYQGTSRGECCVYHDSKIWVYRTIPKGQHRAFRQWIAETWGCSESGEKVTGQYPVLTVD